MSYMINGRTYRNILTTNDQKPTGQGEPIKLNVITTAIIPDVKPQPEPKGTDLSKMITTHDERDIEDMSKDKPDPLVRAPEPTIVNEGWDEPRKKKSGRPKKAE